MIWKYQLDRVRAQQIHMPVGAEILCVQVQYGEPTIWIRLDDPDTNWEPMPPRHLYTIATGGPEVKRNVRYIGTYQLHSGNEVWHVFEGIDDE